MNKAISSLLITLLVAHQAWADRDEFNAPELLPVIEEHVVAEGDTLANLARLHLGPDAPWNTNLAINPELADPNVIVPGQRIKIITGYRAPEPEPEPEIVVEEVEVYQALIEQVSNIVEKNVARTDWQGATEGDELFPLDAVRTLENSAAVLQFDGTSSVLVTEYSQIFLRALETQGSGISRNEIEIVRGETDLRLEDTDSPQQQIEINVAGTITRPERGAKGSNSTRARLVGDDASQVMVYEGTSAVESAGVSVAVETGMGTTAVAGQPPAEPERLLPAPEIKPLDDTLYPTDVRFSWDAVDNAAAYRVDICKDRACTQPILIQRGVTATETSVPSLPLGTGYWRVTPVSQSGLDGFTSLADQINVIEAPTTNWPLLLAIALGTLLLLALIVVFIIKRRRTNVADGAPKTVRLEDEPTQQL